MSDEHRSHVPKEYTCRVTETQSHDDALAADESFVGGMAMGKQGEESSKFEANIQNIGCADEHEDCGECPVCFDLLAVSGRILVCGHVFCIKCLKQMFDSRPVIKCPLCRQKVQYPTEEFVETTSAVTTSGLRPQLRLLASDKCYQHYQHHSKVECNVSDNGNYCTDRKEVSCRDAPKSAKMTSARQSPALTAAEERKNQKTSMKNSRRLPYIVIPMTNASSLCSESTKKNLAKKAIEKRSNLFNIISTAILHSR